MEWWLIVERHLVKEVTMLYKTILLLVVCGIGFMRVANAQVGCASPGTCTNPVPAVNISGTWTASGESWSVTSSSTSVSGSDTVSNPAPGCPAVTTVSTAQSHQPHK